MPIFDEDQANSESSILTAPSSGIGIAPSSGGSPGGGVAAPQPSTPGFMERFAGAFQSVSKDRELRLRERQLRAQEVEVELKAFDETLKTADGLEGDARKQFLKKRGETLDATFPGFAETLNVLAEQPDITAMLREYADRSPTLRAAIETGGMKAGRQLLKSVKGMETVSKEIEVAGLPRLKTKIRGITTGWQQLLPQEMHEGITKDGVITLSELMQASDFIESHPNQEFRKLALTDADKAILSRNEEAVLMPLGILTGKKQEEVLAARAKGETKPIQSRTIKKEVGGKVMDQLQEWDGEKWVDKGKATAHHKPDEGTLPKEVKDRVAKIQLKVLDGEQPTAEERSFLDEVARTNPMVAAMRDALGGAAGAPGAASPTEKTVPNEVMDRFNADAKMKGNKLGKKTDKGWEVRDAKGKLIGYYK